MNLQTGGDGCPLTLEGPRGCNARQLMGSPPLKLADFVNQNL